MKDFVLRILAVVICDFLILGALYLINHHPLLVSIVVGAGIVNIFWESGKAALRRL